MKRFLLTLIFISAISNSFGQSTLDTLKIGYTTAPPFIVENNSQLSGINIWLWERVAYDLEIPFEYVSMEFHEMLEALEKGEIDVSINPLTITSERSKEMEFSDSFYASNSTIVVLEGSALQRFLGFVKGFFSVNFLKGLMVLFCIIFLFGILVWFFERKKNTGQFRSGKNGIWDGVWWSAVTLTTVGYGDKAPQSKMGKIAALLLMFGGLLFISGLTASLASSLTVTQLNSNPDGFNDFKEQTVGTVNNSSSNEFLRKRFFKDIQLYDGVVSGLKDLSQNKIDAFIYDEPILKYRIQQDSTLQSLELLPVKFDAQFYAFGLSKGHIELEQAISQQILEIIESQEWQFVLQEYGLSDF